MIDPIQSLSFSVQANPGVYALLLGSGVSRGAGIPTGWEIVHDVILQLAILEDEEELCQPNPELWYFTQTGRIPNYSEILEQLLLTPAERQQKLCTYIEPTVEEQEEGLKQPTAAHRAIAQMVAQGYIKVIVTTNFDRLLENALNELGIVPNVLSSIHQIEGALPLVHTRCCILKVHGDYLDPLTLNTLEELEEYSDEFNEFLDRVFDEFGLVVCGWSADWDIALRNALSRAESKRFSTYWAVRGEPTEAARSLINHRQATLIHIEDADSFFDTVKENVESIEEFSRPHPGSTELAVSSLKRYLPESRHRVRLSTLIDEIVEQVVDETSGQALAVHSDEGAPVPNTETIEARVRAYEAACSTLTAMAVVGGYWAEEEHIALWQRALRRLADLPDTNGYPMWLSLQRYPATLLLYALGLGAAEANRLEFLTRVFSTEVSRRSGTSMSATQFLPTACMFGDSGRAMRSLPGMGGSNAPLNEWIHNGLRQSAESVIPGQSRYTLMFDKLEILMGLHFAYQRWGSDNPRSYWTIRGTFLDRRPNTNQLLEDMRGSINRYGGDSPFVKANIFGYSAPICIDSLDLLEHYIDSWTWLY